MTRVRHVGSSWYRLGMAGGWMLAVWSVLFAAAGASAQDVPELQITSKHYIVIDADTGEVFAQRNAHDHVAIASLTKVFTTVMAIETANPDLRITTASSDLRSEAATTMGFGPGETFSLRDLIYGMMLPSGNDAAYAVARGVGYQPGDTDQQAVARFVSHANQRLSDMGLKETHLVNPDGWGVPNHFSSAHDLAIFAMYAIRYPRFVDAISSTSYDTADGEYHLTNTNKLLNQYDGLIGGKTGYDDDAGWCLIEVARRDGDTMVAVTLDGVAPDDWYDDNRVLLDYAFEQKAARRENRLSTIGEVLAFKDPDAAVIARSAVHGGSMGAPAIIANPPSNRQNDRASTLGAARGAVPSRDHERQRRAAFAVAALILLARGATAFSGTRRSSPAR